MEQIAKAALLVHWFQPPPDGRIRNRSISSTTRPSFPGTKARRSPRLRFRVGRAAAAICPRPGRAADARIVFRHHRSRHGQGRDQRHHADRPDLPARQDRAEASCAADLHLLSGTISFPAARSKAMPAAPQAARSAMPWGRRRRGGLGNRRSHRRGRQRRGGHRRRRERQSAAQRLQVHCRKRQAEIHACSVPKAFRCGRR